MTVQRDPDTVLSAWLDGGPTELPDATRRAILTSLPTTSQARRGPFAPWRFSQMNTTSRLVVAAIVAVVAIGGALYLIGSRPGVGGPSSQPTTIPTPTTAVTVAPITPGPSLPDTAGWVTITSDRFGVSFKAPADWTVTKASAPWIWQTHDPGPSAFDDAIGPDRADYKVASELIPAGMTDAAWWDDFNHPATVGGPAACFPTDLGAYRQTTVDGHLAYVHGEQAQCNFSEALVLVGGRAYELVASPNVSRIVGVAIPPRVFDAWLATVHFDPASANDAVPASPRPS